MIDNLQIITDYISGKSINKISKEYGINTGTIYRLLKDLGCEILSTKNRGKARENEKLILELHRDNFSVYAIANKIGLNTKTVYEFLKARELKCNYKAKRNNADCVKEMYDNGMRVCDIAREKNLSRTAIYSKIKVTKKKNDIILSQKEIDWLSGIFFCSGSSHENGYKFFVKSKELAEKIKSLLAGKNIFFSSRGYSIFGGRVVLINAFKNPNFNYDFVRGMYDADGIIPFGIKCRIKDGILEKLNGLFPFAQFSVKKINRYRELIYVENEEISEKIFSFILV